jgi:predicted nucleic acid-binding protein
MKYVFVLDENVLIAACKGRNAKNEEDYSSSTLFLQIAQNCHRIAWNDRLKGKYIEKSEILKTNKDFNLFMKAYKILFHLMTKAEKNLQNENYLDCGPDLEDDKHVISLAVFTNGILVSEDGRLMKRLLDKGLIPKYDIKIVEPKEAVLLANEK